MLLLWALRRRKRGLGVGSLQARRAAFTLVVRVRNAREIENFLGRENRRRSTTSLSHTHAQARGKSDQDRSGQI